MDFNGFLRIFTDFTDFCDCYRFLTYLGFQADFKRPYEISFVADSSQMTALAKGSTC